MRRAGEVNSSRLVILNLADPGGIGPVSRVKSGLQAKQRARATVTVGDAVVPETSVQEPCCTPARCSDSRYLPRVASGAGCIFTE